MLVLASRSPQRSAILTQLGVPFEARPADVEELEAGEAHAVAAENARRKAVAIGANTDELVLGVDTVVSLDGAIYGKPADAEAAVATLLTLAGRTHEVVSGLCLSGSEPVTDVTRVTFRELDDAAIRAYVATGEWEGRAGGYAIQGRGAALVRRIEGDYLNVVGLPVAALLDRLPDLLR
jgi:septum formation protein